jgi:ABC-type polysaccharide/polyol phosphate transport system ATPase subunit
MIIDVDNIGIKYMLYGEKKRRLKDLLHPFGNGSGKKEFWALRNVSFKVNHGEALGVIGKNGSGKSTLLMTLTGILAPDEGNLKIEGIVSTLLTLGAGFMPDLTGSDNIYLNGAFLGLNKREINEKYHEIVEFSDLGEFIHAPVKNYSSGMKARLGFSIAASINPDILLIDEVLGVGDVAFREKCKVKMRELMKRARAIIIVTHEMDYITELCNKALWIDKGKIMALGEPEDVVKEYLACFKK